MKTIDVIIVVDVQAALSSGNLNNIEGSVHLMDNQGYSTIRAKGQPKFRTICKDGDKINWHVATVNPDDFALINSFTGKMVKDKVCVPSDIGGSPNQWEGSVQARGVKTFYRYAIHLNLGDGAKGAFHLFLQVNGHKG